MHGLGGVNIKHLAADGRVTGSDLASAMCSASATAAVGTAAIAEIYDGIDATGTLIGRIEIPAGDTEKLALGGPVAITSGEIFVDLTGAGSTATITWK